MDVLKTEGMVQSLDTIRVQILRFTLKFQVLRKLYGQSHHRLALGMLVTTVFYLPLAFLKPEWILAAGPLIFGYPHLVASLRFSTFQKKYVVFALATAVMAAIHLSGIGLGSFGQLPFGVWQILVALIVFMAAENISKLLALLLAFILIKLAWAEPVLYVGGILIAHNWVGFAVWIRGAKTSARRQTAILSTLLFLIIHGLVLSGFFDGWIPREHGALSFPGTTSTTGWYLASWTADPLVWYRMLVLYVFGLSVHYFVWLKAIPETRSAFEHPNSFRMILKNLKMDLGEKTLILSTLIALVGVSIWLLDFSLGTKIYFEVAILHGALEMFSLLAKDQRV